MGVERIRRRLGVFGKSGREEGVGCLEIMRVLGVWDVSKVVGVWDVFGVMKIKPEHVLSKPSMKVFDSESCLHDVTGHKLFIIFYQKGKFCPSLRIPWRVCVPIGARST